MKKYVLLVIIISGWMIPAYPEIVRGRIACSDTDLLYSVILADRRELGPYRPQDAAFEISLPRGTTSGTLIFHGFEEGIQSFYADIQRPFTPQDYFQASYSFRVPSGAEAVDLGTLRMGILQFRIQQSEETAAQTTTLQPGTPIQLALLKDGYPTSVSRIIPLEQEFTIRYLVWPGAAYSLAFLDPEASQASRQIIQSQSIRVTQDCTVRTVYWIY
ncbi:hypothetical protein [Spirochaeta lutea]|uniref:Uncharacterized protein n=1 Tax=Spirochaeta lutea TaxID=1480694 RepID=A0A098QTA5_9SPIO|nr:hypothetical protein [Spirochaeta lutea]KGE71105.1 hypothetical protein DC28_12705 [Spirochaeta lutea]